jgi:hypothetical protein
MESNQLQQYNNNVKELDYWLGEVGLLLVTTHSLQLSKARKPFVFKSIGLLL